MKYVKICRYWENPLVNSCIFESLVNFLLFLPEKKTQLTIKPLRAKERHKFF